MTHPSYKEHYGTNPDHARNTLSNCGIRQPHYGDKRAQYVGNRKRGINMLISIMSRFGKNEETESKVKHNERLEFLGDAVVEFITSVHLFHMFPDVEEGGLATYRAALVQNHHLAILGNVSDEQSQSFTGNARISELSCLTFRIFSRSSASPSTCSSRTAPTSARRPSCVTPRPTASRP